MIKSVTLLMQVFSASQPSLISEKKGCQPCIINLVTVSPFFIFAEEASTIWRETSRLKNPVTGVLGTRKIGTGEYYRVNSGSVLKMITRSETSTNQSGSAMNRPGLAAQSGSEMNRSGSLRTYQV